MQPVDYPAELGKPKIIDTAMEAGVGRFMRVWLEQWSAGSQAANIEQGPPVLVTIILVHFQIFPEVHPESVNPTCRKRACSFLFGTAPGTCLFGRDPISLDRHPQCHWLAYPLLTSTFLRSSAHGPVGQQIPR